MRPGDFGELTYTFEDVVKALNQVQPYDWRTYLRRWLDGTDGAHLLDGVDLGGYRLVWRDEPNIFDQNTEDTSTDLGWSLGLSTNGDGKIGGVLWGSPAFKAKLAPGLTIVAVNGMAFTGDRLGEAVKAAKSSTTPIMLLIRDGDAYKEVAIDYHGGLRFPSFEKTGRGDAGIDRMLKPL
jgi:predicted metalloprotease with PDZ domain